MTWCKDRVSSSSLIKTRTESLPSFPLPQGTVREPSFPPGWDNRNLHTTPLRVTNIIKWYEVLKKVRPMPSTVHSDQTAEYIITVQGMIGADWSDYLGGLALSSSKRSAQPTTTLSGTLIDQGALLGVLNNLYTLGFSILTVEHQIISNKEKNYV